MHLTTLSQGSNWLENKNHNTINLGPHFKGNKEYLKSLKPSNYGSMSDTLVY